MENCEEKKSYGGQAVIEGVMMRGKRHFAVAVRRLNGDIETKTEEAGHLFAKLKFFEKPFLRGTAALIDSMVLGMKALMYSADIAMKDIENAENVDNQSKQGSDRKCCSESPGVESTSGINDMALSITMVLGLALGFGVFFFVPILLAKPLKQILPQWQLAIFEGLIKVALFVGYVYIISFMKDIRRVFQYHGAEHKTINAYEDGAALERDVVFKYPKEHVRCGTSFILVVLAVSILVFMFLPWDNPFLRFAYKLSLLPVVAGIAYEIIKFAGKKKESFFTRLALAPGLFMQKLTTLEPEPEMVDVAIASLKKVLEAENSQASEKRHIV